MTKTITSLLTRFLELPPSCIEFCAEAPEYFVVGTYLLADEEQQERRGSLELFRLEDEGPKLSHVQTIPIENAILDVHFSPRKPTILGVAQSSATVQLYQLSETGEGDASLSLLQTITVDSSPLTLALALAWAPPLISDSVSPTTDIFAVTLSTGEIAVRSFADSSYSFEGNGLESSKGYKASMLTPPVGFAPERWTSAFALQLTGEGEEAALKLHSGDDAATLTSNVLSVSSLTARDIAIMEDEEDELDSTPTHMDARTHGAGVVAILPLPGVESIMLTGSYDCSLRVYDAKLPRRGNVLAEEELGGGVWRLKLLNHTEAELDEGREKSTFLVLASCMHAGARVVEISCTKGKDQEATAGDWDIEVLAQFEEHESMNYGSDVMPTTMAKGERIFVSTSFYDKRLCVWRF